MPSAATFSDFSGRIIGSTFIVSGHVADDSPGPDVVHAAGAVNGVCTTTASGKFEFIGQFTGDRNVTLYIHDDEGIDSATIGLSAMPPPANAPPYVSFNAIYGADRTVTFSGMVYDESPGTCMVSITGAATATNITPDASGAFSVTVTASSLGTVYCQAWDFYGVASNVDFLDLVNYKPIIDSFSYVPIDSTHFRIVGHVTDESVQGIVVHFGGEVHAVSGLSAVCDGNGNFQIDFVRTDTTDTGEMTADCVDWWGLAADTAFCWMV